MCSYKGVAVCVVYVFVIVGSVSGFALDRHRRDLEKTILDHYGSSHKEEQIYSTSSTASYDPRSHGAEEANDQSTTISIDPNVLIALFGPPPEPPTEKLRQNFLSLKPVQRKTRKEDKDKINIHTTAPPPPEAMTDVEKSSTNNTVLFDYEDRFLTEDLLRTQLVTNYERINAKPRLVVDPVELELRPPDNGRNLKPTEPIPEPPLKTLGSLGPRLPLPPRRSGKIDPPTTGPHIEEPGSTGIGTNPLFRESEPIRHNPVLIVEDSKPTPGLVTKSTSNSSRTFLSSFLLLPILFFNFRNNF